MAATVSPQGEVRTSDWHIRLTPEGFVHVVMAPGTVQTLASARESARAVIEVSGGVRRPALVDLRGLKYQEREAREFLASPAGCASTTAFALLVDSAISRTLANLYFTVLPLPVPHRMFTDADDARRWLRAFSSAGPAT